MFFLLVLVFIKWKKNYNNLHAQWKCCATYVWVYNSRHSFFISKYQIDIKKYRIMLKHDFFTPFFIFFFSFHDNNIMLMNLVCLRCMCLYARVFRNRKLVSSGQFKWTIDWLSLSIDSIVSDDKLCVNSVNWAFWWRAVSRSEKAQNSHEYKQHSWLNEWNVIVKFNQHFWLKMHSIDL